MPRLLALLLVLIAPTAAGQEIMFECLDGPRGGSAEVVAASDGTLFIRTAGWARSDDGGDTWTALDQPLNHLTPLAGDTLLAGTNDGVQRSTDTRLTWAAVDLDVQSNNIRTLTRAPSGAIYAATDRLYRSDDDGLTWTEVASDLPYLVQLLADADGALFGRSEYGPVLASFDEGATWEPLTSETSITSLAFDAEGYL